VQTDFCIAQYLPAVAEFPVMPLYQHRLSGWLSIDEGLACRYCGWFTRLVSRGPDPIYVVFMADLSAVFLVRHLHGRVTEWRTVLDKLPSITQ
jgi:hypothetical protein